MHPRTSILMVGLLAVACVDVSHVTDERGAPARSVVSSNFTVTRTADDGVAGSLRFAIGQANASPDASVIEFDIPGTGPHILAPIAALPAILGNLTIDGYTQPGSSANTLGLGAGTNAVIKIELRGTAQTHTGLALQGSGVVVRGLSITGWNNGIEIIAGATGQRVEGNFIGVEADGATARMNNNGVSIRGTSNVVGGTTPETRNILSGNNYSGVYVWPEGSSNTIQGNLIGVDKTGTIGKANTYDGVTIDNSADNLIGGTAAEARNVLSGNGYAGVHLQRDGGNGIGRTLVKGNIIGPDVTGSAALASGSQRTGVKMTGLGSNVIGGLEAGARNIISANTDLGVEAVSASGNRIEGNYIGVDLSGSATLANFNGIYVNEPNIQIIGNVVSGNVEHGIYMRGAPGASVRGNLIGTDATGTIDLGNGRMGILMEAITALTIGGTSPGDGNVIAGNSNAGIYSYQVNAAVIQGNRIGVTSSGAPMGNGYVGLFLARDAHSWLIGGATPQAANIIANNASYGVFVNNGSKAVGMLGNSIHSNNGLGIQLEGNDGADAVTANDAGDPDTGPNQLQNFPVLTYAGATAISTTVTGTLNSNSAQTYRLEFFGTSSADASGYGEGETFLGTTDVTTDVSGDATFSVELPVALPVGHYVTATATAVAATEWTHGSITPYGYTSEFSAARVVEALPNRAPIANAGPAVISVVEGSPVTLDGGASYDPDGDAITYQWRLLAGYSGPAITLATTTGATTSFTPTDNGEYTIRLTVRDPARLNHSVNVRVRVRNAEPVANAGPNLQGVWEVPLALRGSADDPGAGDVTAGLTASWDFGDGAAPSGDFNANHAFASPGSYIATLTVADKDGGTDVDRTAITVGKRTATIVPGTAPRLEYGAGGQWSVQLQDNHDPATARLGGLSISALFITLQPGVPWRSVTATANAAGVATFNVPADLVPGAYTVSFGLLINALYTTIGFVRGASVVNTPGRVVIYGPLNASSGVSVRLNVGESRIRGQLYYQNSTTTVQAGPIKGLGISSDLKRARIAARSTNGEEIIVVIDKDAADRFRIWINGVEKLGGDPVGVLSIERF